MLTTTLTFPDINQVTGAINWSASCRDLLIALIFVLAILIHIFLLKRDKIFALLFAIYVSYILVLFFPYNLWLSHLSLEQITWVKAGGFVLLTIVLAVIFSRSHIFANPVRGIMSRFFQGFVFGILNAALCLSLLASLLPLAFVSRFSTFSQNIFTSDLARFVWLILPLLAILFLIKIRRKGPGRPVLEY